MSHFLFDAIKTYRKIMLNIVIDAYVIIAAEYRDRRICNNYS